MDSPSPPPTASYAERRWQAQADWVSEHAVPFDTVLAGSGFDDLAPLREIVGDARIVGLGEGTHGTREFFQMKHRLVEYLATELGFTVFAIEANMPEAQRLNDYVLGGEGDPEALIGGMYFWTWNTEEVLALVEWMRAFNASGRGPLVFAGFDCQSPPVAADSVRAFVAEVEPGYAAEVDEAYRQVEDTMPVATGIVATVGRLPVEAVAGTRLSLEGYIRTEGIDDPGGAAGLVLESYGASGEILGWVYVAPDCRLQGTTPWMRYEGELDVAEDAASVALVAFVRGRGTAWFDDIRLEADGKAIDVESLDLGFEGPDLQGFTTQEERADHFTLDRENRRSGRQSLRIERPSAPEAADIAFDAAVAAAEGVLEHLADARDTYVEQAPAGDVDWATQNARVVAQSVWLHCGECAADSGGTRPSRDESMADNVAWLLERYPDARIVLWAHNGHVAKGRDDMGRFLDRRFGDDYLSVGFATYGGKYRARSGEARWTGPIGTAHGDDAQWTHELGTPTDNSVEHVLVRTGLPRLILDVRRADRLDDAARWLTRRRDVRSVGALALADQFRPMEMARTFDVLVFIRDTTASVALPSAPARWRR